MRIEREVEKDYEAFDPPTFQKRAIARELTVNLETRLLDFLNWLAAEGIWLECDAGKLSRATHEKLVIDYAEM